MPFLDTPFTDIRHTSIEGSMVIIAACIPVLLPLLDLFTRILGRKKLPPVRPYRPSRHITIRWRSSGRTDGRASIPGPYRAICSSHLSETEPSGLLSTTSAQSSSTEQNRANSDWRRLDNDADATSDAQPGFEQCFGLTDMEEDKLMIWNYGRLSVAPRYEEVIIPIDDASPNLPGIPAHVHTRRVYPETYP